MDNPQSAIENQKSEPVNILLVDDRPENLLALETVLADLGQNLVKANSGREALRCLLNQDFAVILLDVQMPEMDGFETAALIRERERSRHTPIIFLTAIGKSIYEFVHPEDAQNALQAIAYRLENPDVPTGIMEIRARHADGSWRVLEGRGDNLLANQGVKGIVLNFRDITERKRAEIILGETRERIQRIFKSSPDAIWMIDLDGTIAECNQTTVNLHRYSTRAIASNFKKCGNSSAYCNPSFGQLIR